MTSNESSQMYEGAARRHGAATESGDHVGANAAYEDLVEALKAMRAACDKGLRALVELTSNENLSVRVWAATHLLPLDSRAAIAVLSEAAQGAGLVSFSASIVIKEWNAGRLKLPM